MDRRSYSSSAKHGQSQINPVDDTKPGTPFFERLVAALRVEYRSGRAGNCQCEQLLHGPLAVCAGRRHRLIWLGDPNQDGSGSSFFECERQCPVHC